MEPAESTPRERAALRLVGLAIALGVLLQAPGRIVPETKLDITLDPLPFLARSLGAWDPAAGFGRVQNQAIGYLFPMGPFSVAGQAAGLPPWLVQRLWIALVLVLGLWGAHRVAMAVGVATPGGRVVAASAYALAPATMSVVAFQSAGQLPYALAPHVLVPLLRARPGDDPRRVAARSALVVAAMGGVNGASALAVLPLAVVWFATRSPGPDRRRLAGWWTGGVVLATLWWLVPLLISVRYGVRFTAYTEPASLTTLTESGTEVLRGTGNWLSFLNGPGGFWLPGGWALSADRVAIVGSTLLAAGGLAGLARRDAPGRAWALPALLLGALALGVGYSGSWSGPLSPAAHALLDGAAAPFRNVHKVSAVLRLPLALGLGHLVAVGTAHLVRRSEVEGRGPARPPRSAIPVAAGAVAIVAALAPVIGGQLTAPGSFEEIPDHWHEAAAWLDEHDDGDRALLLPSSAFGEYAWGRPLDEPLGVLTDHDWAVRDLIPLGGNGSTRVLDAVDRALQGDALPPGFVAALQRAGVGHLVVRNDLDLVRTGGPRPASVRRLLASAPELELAASFGPLQDDPGDDARLSPRPGDAATEAIRAVDIWNVPAPAPVAEALPVEGAAVVGGGPEAIVHLDPTITSGRATVLAVDPAADLVEDPLLVSTDTLRRRDVAFGTVRNNTTYVLTAGERSPLTGRAPVDRWPTDEPVGLTTARVEGAARITDSRRPGEAVPAANQPFAAFDSDPESTWVPATDRAQGAWIEVELEGSAAPSWVEVAIPATEGRRVSGISVRTDAGSVPADLGPDGRVRVDIPSRETSTIRVTITELTGSGRVAPLGLSEIAIEGMELSRPLVLAPIPHRGSADAGPDPGGADIVSLARDRADRFDLRRRDTDASLDRAFPWAGGAAGVSGAAVSVPGDELDALLDAATDLRPTDLVAEASSRWRALPSFPPAAAFDGDAGTAWVSDPEVDAPRLTVRWQGATTVDRMELDVITKGLDPVERVEVTIGGSTYERSLSATGAIDVPSTIAEEIQLSFPADASDDPDDDAPGRQIAISEVRIPALLGRTAAVPDRSEVVELPCGDGPPVQLDGRDLATTASPTIGDLIDGTPFAWSACDPTELDQREQRLEAPGHLGPIAAVTATIEPTRTPEPAPPARAVEATRWGREDRSVEVAPGDASFLTTTENRNDGWRAVLDGEELDPVTVDGWRQGWFVPAGEGGTVTLTYAPGRVQRAGLLIGAAAIGALIAAAVLRPPRRRPWAVPRERSWGPAAIVAVTAAVGVALGGLLVLPAAAIAVLARRAGRLVELAAGSACVAGAIAFVQSAALVGSGRGTFSGAAQGAAVVALVALGASALPLLGVSPAAGSTPSIPDPSARRPHGTDTTPAGSD